MLDVAGDDCFGKIGHGPMGRLFDALEVEWGVEGRLRSVEGELLIRAAIKIDQVERGYVAHFPSGWGIFLRVAEPAVERLTHRKQQCAADPLLSEPVGSQHKITS